MSDFAGPDRLKLAETLFASFRQDQASGVLDARLHWEEIDAGLLAITGDWAMAARRELSDPDPVSLFGTTGYDWAFFVEALNTISFHHVLVAIANHDGDPPATELLQRYALDILRGRVHLTGAIRLVSGEEALLGALPHLFQTFLPGLDPEQTPVLPQAMRVAAAAALPRSELYRLRGVASGSGAGTEPAPEPAHLAEVRETFARLMADADRRDVRVDPHGQEALLIRALDLAAQSPEPDDDLEVLERILHLAEHVRISPDAVRRSAAAVQMLVARGHHSAAVAHCLTALGPLVSQNDLLAELGDGLVSAGSRLLEAKLPDEAKLALRTTVARVWLGLGRRDRARELLVELQQDRLGPEERLRICLMESDTLEEPTQRSKATDHLLAALDEAGDAPAALRMTALQKLIALWPDHRDTEGLLPYIDELLSLARTLKEPRRTMALVGAAVRLWQANRRVQALRAWSMIDEDRLRREAPPVIAEKVLKVVAKAREKLDSSTAETVAH